MTDETTQFTAVLELFSRLGIDARLEPLGGGGGGLCALRGKRVFFIDQNDDPITRLDGALAALASLPEAELDAVFLPPALREQVERRRVQQA